MLSRRARAAAPALVALAASVVVGSFAVRSILAEAGRPAVPLDDVFIHFQYARRLAEGAPFRYTGDAISTGATSLVWPVLLAPFWKAGVRGLSLVWIAWALGTIAHAGVALDTARLAKRLTNDTGALIAGALCIAFGPFAWFAWSGMETMALAWILVRTTRLASELLDARAASPFSRVGFAPAVAAAPAHRSRSATSLPPATPARRADLELALLGFLAPLVRPEGMLASLFAAIALLSSRDRRRRLLALAPLAGCLTLPALYLALTGDPTSSTARVKLLLYNPYFSAGRFFTQLGEHARLLLFDVLDGGEWTWIFVPKGLVVLVLLGAVALARSSRRAPWAAWLTLALATSVVLTCSYQTFLWNRVRYVWPFVPAAFVMCACLFHELGQLARRVRPAFETVTPALGAALVARLAVMLPASFADLSQSAHAVDQQQVKLGEWARAALPQDALVGVNDTGAIAYLGERRTFDVVGLTTEGEGPAWLAGAGSRFERYERFERERLPTHFIVYPEWFGADVLLGDELARATVTEHAILGGDTMTAHLADWTMLGSGALPLAPPEGEVLRDEVDVADLDSERAHGFELGDAWETEDIVRTCEVTDLAELLEAARRSTNEPARSGRHVPFGELVDGGRLARARDTFFFARSAPFARLVARLGADEPIALRVLVDGQEVGHLTVPKTPWIELEMILPEAPAPGPRTRIDILAPAAKDSPPPQNTQSPRATSRSDSEQSLSQRAGPRFASFHYWLYAR